MKRLWVHEVLRVYGDRLVDVTDIKWLVHQIRATVSTYLDDDLDRMFQDLLKDNQESVRLHEFQPLKCFLLFVKTCSAIGDGHGTSESDLL